MEESHKETTGGEAGGGGTSSCRLGVNGPSMVTCGGWLLQGLRVVCPGMEGISTSLLQGLVYRAGACPANIALHALSPTRQGWVYSAFYICKWDSAGVVG